MGKVFFFGWEIPLMLAFQSVGSTFLTAVATFFTVLGEEYPLVLVLGFLYWCCDKELARRVGLAFSGAIVFSTVLFLRSWGYKKLHRCVSVESGLSARIRAYRSPSRSWGR